MVLGGIKMKRALTYFVVGVGKEENLYYVINVQRHFVKGKTSCVKILSLKGICFRDPPKSAIVIFILLQMYAKEPWERKDCRDNEFRRLGLPGM